MFRILILILFLNPLTGISQTIHKVPIASKNNVIELAFNNSFNKEINKLRIEITQTPGWVTFKNKEAVISGIKSNESKSVSFNFNINDETAVNEKGEIVFKITDLDYQKAGNKNYTYNKTINIVTTPPDKFELMQNYPNPFNPITTISILVPKQSFINLAIYNLLGERVETLINEERIPGFYKTEFNAGNFASGVYFYTLKTNDPSKGSGQSFIQTKKMVILK